MDFWQLLGLAEGKQKEKPSGSGNFLSTKISPAQKDPKQKRLSDNVKKFMESKVGEQKAKEKEDESKRKNLLQLRSENKKSQRTMKAMLSMTKSADKSALADVKQTAPVSFQQCDEDDYGYESNAARAFFDKLISKFEQNPEDPMDKFTKSGNKKKISTDLQATKSRVLERLAEGEDERDVKSVRKSSSSSAATTSSSTSMASSGSSSITSPGSSNSKKDEKKKVAPKHPPPPSFADLIKMAAEAKSKPIDTKSKSNFKDFEFDRPMTSKEKEEYFREKASQARKSGKEVKNGSTTAAGSSKPGPASSKISKQSAGSKSPPTAKVKDNPSIGKKVESLSGKGDSAKKVVPESSKKSNITSTEPPKKPVPKIVGPEFHPAVVKKPAPKEESRLKNALLGKQKSLPPKQSSDKKSLSKPSGSKRSRSRSRSRSPEYRRSRLPSRSPSPEIQWKSSSKRQRIDSESEYDSEMDDFIDDSDAKVDISAEIRKIFGYDRRKFRHEADFDDRSMETNRFADVMKEEARSAKIGRMEDLEDMRREEEEKRRKMMKKKKR